MEHIASTPLHLLTASEAAARIRAGSLTSEALVNACLERIAERDPEVRAWAHLDPDAALARARDRQARRGPLHGVPIGIKDIFDTAGAPTSYGSPIYAGHRPPVDAACLWRLEAAGAVLLGKTVTTEFALFTPAATRNPHDPGRTPGGSSSGSAAAVADGHVPLALGTQTAGSIVRPASFCGIFGLKPTLGRVPTAGVKPCAPSLDTVGAFARSAADLALIAAVLLAEERLTANAPRIGFARTPQWNALDPATQTLIERAVEALRLPEIELPVAFAELPDAQAVVMGYEAVRALGPEREDHGDQLSPGLRGWLDEMAAHSDAEYREALARAATCRQALTAIWTEVDVLLVPSVLGEAPEGLDSTGDPLLCRAWTLLGNPTVAVPGLTGPAGLPVGVQVVAPPGRDDLALAAAAWLQEQWA